MLVFGLWMKEAIKGLIRNILMNSFAMLLTVVCFAMFAMFTIIGINAKYISANQENKVPIELLLKENVTDYQSVDNRIKQMTEVKSDEFVSKDEAYEQMKQMLGNRANMLTDLGFNPLPASFEIKLKNPRDMEKVVKTIESWGVAEDVRYGQEFLNNFFKVTDKINQLSFWIIMVMSVASGTVIYSSIRMNILNRNKEIEIKNLIGAGSLNIRIPFVLEAVLLTVMSATIVLVGVDLFYDELIKMFNNGMPTMSFMSTSQVIKSLIPPVYFVAVVIGVVSSVLSTQRYLKRH